MTPEIFTILIILTIALILFISNIIRAELVALMVLISLALSQLVTTTDAISGFSNPVVITLWAMFIISAGLYKTGVANIIGKQILRFSGKNDSSLIIIIMLTAGTMSAFINNTGVVALLLPVVMDIARKTNRPPSLLLIPLAYGSLFGGLTTMVGTPPNILVSNALRDWGLPQFQLFDYTPIGLPILIGGTLFMAFIGKYLLPKHNMKKEYIQKTPIDIDEHYNLTERSFIMRIPEHSALNGQSLASTRLRSIIGLNVVAIIRNGKPYLIPEPNIILQNNDRLIVHGRLDRLNELRGWKDLIIEPDEEKLDRLINTEIDIIAVHISPNSDLIDKTLGETHFRQKYGVNVLAIRRKNITRRTSLQNIPIQAGDILLLQGTHDRLDNMKQYSEFDKILPISKKEIEESYYLQKRIFVVRIPDNSQLIQQSISQTRLGDSFGLIILAILRNNKTILVPGPDDIIQAGDRLLINGKLDNLTLLHGLQDLIIEEEKPPDFRDLDPDNMGMVEVVLSPHSIFDGKTLRAIQFRDKFGLLILAIWRNGRAYRSNLSDIPLKFGDAFLVYGPKNKLQNLATESDFLVLTQSAQQTPSTAKAPFSISILIGILIPVILGWIPIYIAGIIGAILMVLLGCLKMEDAYRAIEWKVIFIIAGMLPLGIALHNTGVTYFLADKIISSAGLWGSMVVLISFYLVTLLAILVIPPSVIVVIMSPIALTLAENMNISPYALMMALAMSASIPLISPISHPANILIMGPGEYKFIDFIKVGLPLTLIILLIVILILPIFYPLSP